MTYNTDKARLSWTEDGYPYSEVYGDVYYSKADALGESTHVFLEGNELPGRFANATKGGFTIGELGFGAGLNFLNTCRLWQQLAPTQSTLHYLACELHPFSHADIKRVHALLPALSPYSQPLLKQYPDHCSGIHQLDWSLGEHRISLTLLYGDASELLGEVKQTTNFTVDAWFLDGFAPKTNPGMWQESLFRQLYALSGPATTLSSYSVASGFRQALSAAGFAWDKKPGYARKKHMLCAHPLLGTNAIPDIANPEEDYICVIGAGLAGCTTAAALAKAGHKVIVFDREAIIASQASGNPQGIVHFKPGLQDTPNNRFTLQAYLYACRYYASLPADEHFRWYNSGMLQIGAGKQMEDRFSALASGGLYNDAIFSLLGARDASELIGKKLEHKALYFPASGWLSPPALCRSITDHPNIQILNKHRVDQLVQDHNGWQLITHGVNGQQFFRTRQVIICNSSDAHLFEQTRHLPLVSNLGQVDIYPAQESLGLNTVLCGQGYLIPGDTGVHCTGGSYFISEPAPSAKDAYTQQHLQQLKVLNADLSDALASSPPAQQRTAMRCTIPDRMPVVGAVDAKRHPGLWINVAHGSHGLSRTPVCAAYIRALIDRTPTPLSASGSSVISPSRFK